MRNVIKKHEYYIYGIVLLEILLLTYFTYKYGAHHIDTDDSAEMILDDFQYRHLELKGIHVRPNKIGRAHV